LEEYMFLASGIVWRYVPLIANALYKKLRSDRQDVEDNGTEIEKSESYALFGKLTLILSFMLMKLYKGVIEEENRLKKAATNSFEKTQDLIDLAGDVEFDNETTRAFTEIYRDLVTKGGDIVKDGFELLDDMLIDNKQKQHEYFYSFIDLVSDRVS
jgi:hypothetical protein